MARVDTRNSCFFAAVCIATIESPSEKQIVILRL